MNKRIEIIRIINDCLLISTVFIVLLLGFGIRANLSVFAAALPLALMVLLSELIQAYISNLILFLVGHLGAIALSMFGIGRILSRGLKGITIDSVPVANVGLAISVVLMTVVAILGIYTRVDGKGRYYPEIFEGLIFIVLFVFCRITKAQSAEIVVLVAEMIWGILAVMYYNAKQTIGALVTYHQGDFVPYEQIRQNNSVMLRISLIVTFVLMLLCSLLDYGKELLAAIKSAIVSFLTWLFSHFDFETPEYEDIPPSDEPIGGMGGLLPDEYVDDSIWHKLWDILFWVAAAVVTVLFIYVLVKLIKEFYKIFNSSRMGMRDRISRDKREFLSPLAGDEERAFEKSNKSRLKFFERLSKRGSVRRMFIRYIQGGRGFSDVRESFSPLQMEKISREKDGRAYEIYEKARYSSEEITAEDVDAMKREIL